MKKNLYYVVLGVGVVALVAMMGIYNLNNKADSQTQQKISLNDSADATEGETIDVTEEITEPVVTNAVELEEPSEPKDVTEEAVISSNVTETTIDETENKEEVNETVNTAGQFTEDDKIAWPLVGNVILPYSMNTTIYFETLDQYRCNPGIYIQAPEGTEAAAGFSGTILEISEDKEMGKTVTIDIGNGFVLKYGLLEIGKIKEGEVISKGNLIGKVMSPTGYYEKEGSCLYLQLNKGNEPVNPMIYLEE